MIVEFWKGGSCSYFDFIWFGAFQFECWRGKVNQGSKLAFVWWRRYRTASLFPQQWQPKVKKSSTAHCEVSFTLFYFLAALNFTFKNLIPFGFRSRKAGLLKLPQPCLFPWTFFTLFLRQQPKAKHCLRFKSYIGELLSKFLL